jgi:hypothetical protein
VVPELILRTVSLNYGARMNISMQDLNPIHPTGPSSTRKAPNHARWYRPVLFANTATFERFQPFGRVRDNEGSPKVGELPLVGRDTDTGALVRYNAQPPDCRLWAHAPTHSRRGSACGSARRDRTSGCARLGAGSVIASMDSTARTAFQPRSA